MTDEPPGFFRDSPPDAAPSAVGVTSMSTAAASEPDLPSNLAILPSRTAVLYPAMLLPFLVSAQPWVRLLSAPRRRR